LQIVEKKDKKERATCLSQNTSVNHTRKGQDTVASRWGKVGKQDNPTFSQKGRGKELVRPIYFDKRLGNKGILTDWGHGKRGGGLRAMLTSPKGTRRETGDLISWGEGEEQGTDSFSSKKRGGKNLESIVGKLKGGEKGEGWQSFNPSSGRRGRGNQRDGTGSGKGGRGFRKKTWGRKGETTKSTVYAVPP